MPDPSLIANLANGVRIENLRAFLPWGASEDELVRLLPHPQILHQPAWRRLVWAPAVILAGLQGDALEVDLTPGAHFDSATLWLERGIDEAAAARAYHKAVAHLGKVFGQPLDDPYPNGPDQPVFDRVVAWQTPPASAALHLALGPEFADYSYKCTLTIYPRPKV